ncbi:hypothetical protein RRG08_042529 [Elysia crispata]|uniref:Uncharacterized protein n=1 Tax=Elysia crispata TaxID=231223 RepID=A0AAE0XPU8_9GAST|nr:hypothetical protein RRG08_042529 [Elysia crispata]
MHALLAQAQRELGVCVTIDLNAGEQSGWETEETGCHNVTGERNCEMGGGEGMERWREIDETREEGGRGQCALPVIESHYQNKAAISIGHDRNCSHTHTHTHTYVREFL